MLDLFIAYLEISIVMTAIILSYKVVTPLIIRKYSAKAQYYAWLVILLGLMVPFRFHPNILASQVITSSSAIHFTQKIPVVYSSVTRPIEIRADFSWYRLGCYVWLTGIVIYSSYLFFRYYHFIKVVNRWSTKTDSEFVLKSMSEVQEKLGISTNVGLKICESIDTPLIIGLFQPIILLPPKSLDTKMLPYILEHELIHYKRGDFWFKALAFMAVVAHWFNPAVHIAIKEAALFCECSCDEEVIKGKDIHERRNYIRAIVGTANENYKIPMSFLSNFYSNGSKVTLKRRILSIMDSKRKKTGAVVLAVIGLATISTGTVMAFNFTNKVDLTSSSKRTELISRAELINNDNDHLIGTEVKDNTPPLIMNSSPGASTNEKNIDTHISEHTFIKEVADNTVLPPINITNFEVIDGTSPEIIIPNGSAALFTLEDGRGWDCKAGDKLIYDFEKYKSDIVRSQTMVIGYAIDGVVYPGEEVKELSGKYQLEIDEEGNYYIYVISATSDYLALKEGTIYVIP